MISLIVVLIVTGASVCFLSLLKFEGDLAAFKQEIEEATKEVLRHIFSRDDAEPKFTLTNFPFVDL